MAHMVLSDEIVFVC